MDGKKRPGRMTAANNTWDVAVIGAGPAGATAALLLARRGLSTLLVERKKFPREKVCGGCLNARAVGALRHVGLESLLDTPSTAAIDSFHLRSRRHLADISVPDGVAIVRSEFDEALSDQAQVCGATFRSETTAEVSPELDNAGALRRIVLHRRGKSTEAVYARVVLACDGLGNASLARLPVMGQWIRRRSRLGIGAVVDAFDEGMPHHAICMAIDPAGYVGRVRLGDGRVSVAAALDAATVRSHGPAGAIDRILSRCGDAPLPRQAAVRFQGTRLLTRRARRVANARVFLLGDACGYVEPFTGDGMAIAFETALAVVPLVQVAQTAWSADLGVQWERTVRRITARRHRTCRALSALVGNAWLADLAIATATMAPTLVASLVGRMHRLPHELKGREPWDCTSPA